MRTILIAAALAPFVATAARAAEPAPLVYYGVSFEQLEYRFGDEDDLLAWNGDAFVGTDDVKLRLTSEGEYAEQAGAFETLEHQLALQTPISDFFDAKAGVRYDAPQGPDRWYGVVGVHGLSQQWFEVDLDFFLSEKGDASMRFDADYEILITNRIILTPSAEINVAFSDDPEIGVGSGLSDAELGLRLSYDLIDRAVSPYIGVHYERKFGETAALAKGEGENAEQVFGVVGVKLMY